MTAANISPKIRVAIAGLGNCASSLIEGICYYRQNPGSTRSRPLYGCSR